MESNVYSIKTSGFEGPFNLLLSLVEEKKLFINDVSLAEVTEDYLKYLNNLPEKNPETASGYGASKDEIGAFITVAATLILIKSKSLLPNLVLTEEEQGDIASLETRLKLYELFSKLGEHVRSDFGKNIIFAPLERKNTNIVFLPDEQITKESMMAFAHELVGRIPVKSFLPNVEVKKVISIEEMIDKLTERIQNAVSMSFKDFSGGYKSKEEKVFVIVSFLAMLELVRDGTLDAEQNENFEDIVIEKRKVIVENI